MDSESSNLYYCTAEGDSYLAQDCGDGNYRLTFGGNGRFATVSEISAGYRIVTDEGDEYLVPRRYGVLDYLPFALVASLALWVNASFLHGAHRQPTGISAPNRDFSDHWCLGPHFCPEFHQGSSACCPQADFIQSDPGGQWRYPWHRAGMGCVSRYCERNYCHNCHEPDLCSRRIGVSQSIVEGA